MRPSSSATAASPMAAPSDDAAMTLWPQACPTSGSASYSAHRAIVSDPDPAVARKAVASPATPRSTAKPGGLGRGGDPLGALDLVVAELGVGVDEVADLDELVGRGVDGGRGALGGAHSITATTSPALTESPADTEIDWTTPLRSALTRFSIFIASRMTMVSPASTDWPTSTTTLTIVPCIGTVTWPDPLPDDPGVVLAARLGRGASADGRGSSLGGSRAPTARR